MRYLFIVSLVMLFSVFPVSAYALNVGDEAPLFEAQSTTGTIKLEDYFGKNHVVLAFYYADFTPV